MYRQGDVLLVPVSKEDAPAKKSLRYVPRKPGEGIILAAGEATGHHHRVRERGAREYVDKKGARFLSTGKAGGTLTHEEHDSIALPAHGLFKIVQQREYEPVIVDNTVRQSERRVYD